ncbi:MAG: hypothetical protein A07HB70_00573, partial [uncultured archaeon A07HB70]
MSRIIIEVGIRREFSAALTSDLESVEAVSSPKHNEAALSAHTYAIESNYACRLPDKIATIL